jgi:hypothetical protein
MRKTPEALEKTLAAGNHGEPIEQRLRSPALLNAAIKDGV